jgi:cysteine desulfurase
MGTKLPIYMDHNATTAVYPAVRKAILLALDMPGNASSAHGAGRAARKLIEDARDRVATLVAANSADVVFTSGGTEANNMAIRGVKNGPGKTRILASAVEHSSVLKVLPNIETVPVDGDGIIALDALDKMLTCPPAGGSGMTLVSVMLANNETGVIQPIVEVASIARRHGAIVHCDAVQAAGKIPINFKSLGVHFLSLSAHKIGGPAGVGALVIKKDLAENPHLPPLLLGGGQERGQRAGSENLSGITGFGLAADFALKNLPKYNKLAIWRNRIEEELSHHTDVCIFGSGVPRLANTSSLTMPGVAAIRQIIDFDLAGFALSAGSACSSGKLEPSHVLAAMGVAEEEARTAIRVSLGWTTTDQDIDMFLKVWNDMFKRSRAAAKNLEAA